MTDRTIRYSVGNADNPTDPIGRSELVLRADGRARLDHYFSMRGPTRAWAGQVDAAAVAALLAALDEGQAPPAARPGTAAGPAHQVGTASASGTAPTAGVRVTLRPASRARAANPADLTTAAPPGSPRDPSR
jgi:hypothetical protein